MSTISQQVQDLQNLTVADLAARYEALFGKPPRVKNKAFLRRQVAWKLQEQAFGGLSATAKVRLDELIAQIDLPIASHKPRRRPVSARSAPAPSRAPSVGTTLTRAWQGQQLRVEVRENGFEWNGVLYRSLSAVAKAITGAHWNGRLFFGLTTRSRSK